MPPIPRRRPFGRNEQEYEGGLPGVDVTEPPADPGNIINVVSGPQTTTPLPGEEPPPPPRPRHGGGEEEEVNAASDRDPMDDLPPVPPPPPSNSPLAIQGTFAQPGTPQARPFQSRDFSSGRVVGPTGPGVPLFTGKNAGDDGSTDDYVRRVALRRR